MDEEIEMNGLDIGLHGECVEKAMTGGFHLARTRRVAPERPAKAPAAVE